QLGDDLPDKPSDAAAKTWPFIPDLNRSVRLDRFTVTSCLRAPLRCPGAAVRLGPSRHRIVIVVVDRVECVVELLVLEVLIHGSLAASVAFGHFALFHLYGGWCVAHRALARPGTAPHDVAGASGHLTRRYSRRARRPSACRANGSTIGYEPIRTADAG